MSSIRTFVAVEIPQEARARTAELIGRLSVADVKVKWADPQNVHLTLKFLGDVPQNDIPAVCGAVEAAVKRVEPFAIQLTGAGAFPNTRRPRTVWIGVGDGLKEMSDLHGAVDSALAELGSPKEGRRYVPHLTLGRVRRGGPGLRQLAELIQHNGDFDAGTAIVDQAVVFASELSRDGPHYSVLGRAMLAQQK